MKSAQSVKGALLRSARMAREVAGPMPLMLSSSATVALLSSTVAMQGRATIHNSRAASSVRGMAAQYPLAARSAM